MPSSETAGESARTAPEKLTSPSEDAVPQAWGEQRPEEPVTDEDPVGIPFEAGVSDAWGSGWPRQP